MTIRQLTLADRSSWLDMRRRLWPERDEGRQEREAARFLQNPGHSVVLIACTRDGTPSAFVEISRRPVVEGCDPGPVGFVEGLYVKPQYEGSHLADDLLQAATDWSRSRGCRQLMASADVDDAAGRGWYEGRGFEEAGRMVLFHKPISPVPVPEPPAGIPAASAVVPKLEGFPEPESNRGGWRPAPVHLVVLVLGILSFWFTDIYSQDVLRGAILPILDVVFIIYFIVVIVVGKYRHRTVAIDDGEAVFGTSIDDEILSSAIRGAPSGSEPGPGPRES